MINHSHRMFTMGTRSEKDQTKCQLYTKWDENVSSNGYYLIHFVVWVSVQLYQLTNNLIGHN